MAIEEVGINTGEKGGGGGKRCSRVRKLQRGNERATRIRVIGHSSNNEERFAHVILRVYII